MYLHPTQNRPSLLIFKMSPFSNYYCTETMYWKRKVIANRANCVDMGNNRKIESFRKYTMGFSKQMCHDGKGIMLTLIDSLGHNPC